jgi:hypothetical protein
MRFAVLLLALTSLLAAADKKAPIGQTSNDFVEIRADVINDKEAIKQKLGSDFGGFIVVVEVTVTPKDGQKLVLSRDDFFLRSDKDGQRSQPFAPTQIAGTGALRVRQTAGSGGAMAENNGPIWGGMGGGMPGRLPGSGGGIGNGVSDPGSTEATFESGVKNKENPVLATLKEKILPEKEITGPTQGLLYFPLEGKHKTKDLELSYKSKDGKLILRFKP